MLETSIFKKLLYIISYAVAGLLFLIAGPTGSMELYGICWMFLLIGFFFDIKYFIYKIKNNK